MSVLISAYVVSSWSRSLIVPSYLNPRYSYVGFWKMFGVVVGILAVGGSFVPFHWALTVRYLLCTWSRS